MEEWKTIEGFEQYEVSSLARVRSYKYSTEPALLSGTTTKVGYTAFMLRKRGNPKPFRKLRHRLVAMAFIPNPEGLSDVAHNDGNPQNDIPANLRWATHRDNQMDMRIHGTMQDGEKCVTRKLNQAQVMQIRQRVAAGEVQRRLAEEYGVTFQNISKIIAGNTWAVIK